MEPIEQTGPSRRARGLALMAAAMLTVPSVDAIAKLLSADYSPLFLGWTRYAVACLVVLPVAVSIHGHRLFPAERLPAHLLRTMFLVTAMTLYFLAIARIPLATAISTFFVGPIIAAVLSVVVLKERMTSRKILSLALGFAGSMVILRPGQSVDPGILLALGAGVFFALHLIATRRAAEASDPVKTLAFQCVVGTALLTPQAVATWSTPSADDLVFFAGLGLLSAFGHLLSIAAFRIADASTLAPLVYLQLVASALLGYLAFGDAPGIATLVGAGLIVAAGLVLVQRRDRRAQGTSAGGPARRGAWRRRGAGRSASPVPDRGGR